MIKLCIFDMDGLLLDSERYMWSVNEKKAGQILGYDVSMDLMKRLIGGSTDHSKLLFKEEFGEDFPADEYYDLVFKLNNESVENNEVPLKKGAMEILQYLKSNNIHIALGTSSRIEYAKKILNNLGVVDYFEYIATVDMVKEGKPSPDIFLHAYNQFDVEKEETLVLEDAHNGIIAATRAGIKTILVEDMSILTEEDKKTAILVAKDLIEAKNYIEKINR